MLIGFSKKTSKIFARIFCRRFRHCVVIFQANEIMGTALAKDSCILIQVGTDGLRLIHTGQPEIDKLQSAGWVFIAVKFRQPIKQSARHRAQINILTCVGFAKRALGIRMPFIWTPDQLYRYLSEKKQLL